MNAEAFDNLPKIATHLRQELEGKKVILLYAYNGTGKTRLSMAFKDQNEEKDTLYFNAFTEDLFTWDNDLDNSSQRTLNLNTASSFFSGIEELEMENRIRPFLSRYADFDFTIDYALKAISFSRDIKGETHENIKISRGEENIFVWCFFLTIVQLAMDGAGTYSWVKYIYIDDPISSLDENNAIAVGHHLAQLLKRKDHSLRAVLSSHHSLFFNVMWNEMKEAFGIGKKKKCLPYFLSHLKDENHYTLRYTGDTPNFHHVAMLTELCQVRESGKIYTYHFNMLRSILEKSASFHGFKRFSDCLGDDPDTALDSRVLNIINHGNYSFYEPREMLPDNKDHFRKILEKFLSRYPFNPELFPEEPEAE